MTKTNRWMGMAMAAAMLGSIASARWPGVEPTHPEPETLGATFASKGDTTEIELPGAALASKGDTTEVEVPGAA
jgi:hypothetical protein